MAVSCNHDYSCVSLASTEDSEIKKVHNHFSCSSIILVTLDHVCEFCNFNLITMIFIYCVYKDKEEADKITRILLEKKMVICGNQFVVSSMYLWKEKIESDSEVVVFYKTFKQNYKSVRKEIEKHHSYEVPFIASVKINEVNESYYHLLKQTVSKYYGKKSPEAKPNLQNPDLK
ncbi:MAG: CutA1 divalent ion tolerance protein [candidate division CPR3 bacterium GW2011_GWF2_35_18]|uniref:CutA1 divalent ion tolerance protein n=1 Tax=candidate division CPR3 bacterium GW2011_GWF2_35_18 TaxID=1618350 RepID=A0A0G0E276_UNCC3|nr:MAG: CutA1 divalent ion tolerance protein [candidate division CPR3 bacterium GW2011_GWF2_35_18]